MSAPPKFAEKVAGYSDVQLAEVLASASDYTPESLKIVMAEWDKRKLTTDAVASELAQATQQAEFAAKPKPTQSITVKGVGLICYGRDFGQIGGYVTTQWFCMFLIPLVPVQSFYVEEIAFGAEGAVTATRINLRQIVRTYLLLIFGGAFGLGAFELATEVYEKGHEYWAFIVAGTSVLAPTFCLQLWRRKARRRKFLNAEHSVSLRRTSDAS